MDAIPHSTKACQCQHASVVKKKTPTKQTNRKLKCVGVELCWCCFFLYQESCGLLLGPLDKTKRVIEFGRVPFLLCLMVKVELEKEKKKKKGCFALPHLCTFTEGDCINRERNVLPPLRHFWSSNVGQMKALFYWSDEVHLERQRGFKSYWNKARRRCRLAMQAVGCQSFNLHRSADKSTPEFSPPPGLRGSWAMNKPSLAFEAFWCNIQPWITPSAPGQLGAEAPG